MFDVNKEWSISFAGCGFMGIYYVGASSCILERFPHFIQGASKIYGSSAGSLMAAALTTGIPLEKCCADLMCMAKEARKHKLGPLHPTFNLLQMVQDSLLRSLPDDAHVRASGKLCVSLTRVSDGKNVLVSDFDTREELIQVLLCSCFVPFYCGIVPPVYRGVHYVDGAVSDNLPRCHLKYTVTVSAYAGESDISPPAGTMNLHEVRFNNVSIQVSAENMYRVTSTFFPPEPEVMSKICQNGYIDALRFLQENNLITSNCALKSLELDSPRCACCELVKEQEENTRQDDLKHHEHFWLNPQLTEKLPIHIRMALCEACRAAHAADGLFSHVAEYLPKKVTSYLQIPCTRPIESAYSLARRLVDWIPDVTKDMSWLCDMAEDVYKQAWKKRVKDNDREAALHRCTSLPLGLNMWSKGDDDLITPPLTPEGSGTPSLVFNWDENSAVDNMPLTPPPTPTFSHTSEFEEAASESPNNAGRGWGLGRAVGWFQNIALKRQEKK
ncbi:patatin-like phospholipase domain-containing protein 2 [Solea senegalensis]|uniref:triacylglycerol lipase n=1 Tax=Solea senegalensis TaxID=28829 RepID=A0AAV6SXG2_SOLSE|nr:1-acylglycerol-3-phosphate O-acyltransferase Pnpla3-like [Solea senegalensis]KAG7522056.1 patatin-like phospholipase domain-containing protein 2 [Solea senegalensis]